MLLWGIFWISGGLESISVLCWSTAESAKTAAYVCTSGYCKSWELTEKIGVKREQEDGNANTRPWEWRPQHNYLSIALPGCFFNLDFFNLSLLSPRSPDRLGSQQNRYGAPNGCRQTEEQIWFESTNAPCFTCERGLYREKPANIYFASTAVVLIRSIR